MTRPTASILALLLGVAVLSAPGFCEPSPQRRAPAATPATGERMVPRRLPATATASSTGAAGPAALAVDGDLDTRWESQHGVDPSWLSLDLGMARILDRVVLRWEAANAATYRIEGSLDGAAWSTLATRAGGTFGDRVDTVGVAGVYRHVRMLGLTRSAGNQWGYSLWEVEVFGAPAPDSDGDGVDDTRDLCPGTPPGTPVDGDGCPIVLPEREVAFAGGILVGGPDSAFPGGSLYVSDLDLTAPGTSTCDALCAVSWPPLLVTDGDPSGVGELGSVPRAGGGEQVTYQGRPLYFHAGDAQAGDMNGQGLGGNWWVVPYAPTYLPLFDGSTPLEPPLQEDTPAALVTRFADRARDRHAREDQFQAYDHYLTHYWEHRTAEVEIVDTVAKGGSTITFNVATQWRLSPTEAELRFLYRGINTVAEYHDNGVMASVPALDDPTSNVRHYTRSLSFNPKTGQPLRLGDRLEFELSQFLDAVPQGRNNYYGTALLYVVGEGLVPWEARGVFGDPTTEREDSFPMDVAGHLGGGTTLPYRYSNEPDKRFMQMAGNLAPVNGQPFVLGRRVHHTDMGDGSHDESTGNPAFAELAGTLGPHYGGRSCVACHGGNGRALPPAPGAPLTDHLVLVGDAQGDPHPLLGRALQPLSTGGAPEGGVTVVRWDESGGLRTPVYQFTGPTPARHSVRIAPQLVGMGLLEAIPEADLAALADPMDADGDGISGRLRLVVEADSGIPRVGRFGWKAAQPTVRHQVASALNVDMGVMSSVRPEPDRGAQQSGVGPSGAEIADGRLAELSAYVALLGVNARRDLDDAQALQGEALFGSSGCVACHTPTFRTTPFHPHAELRDQEIHPYTDLLLHDMGPGLASTLDEDGATGAEWRTAPLWGIGSTAEVSGGEAYLHDGRARTLDEAIRWHDGEAAGARQAYLTLGPGDQAALLAFLRSL